MLKVLLTRDLRTDGCTLGKLSLPVQGVTFHTLENPWMFNKPNISCIPAGTYQAIIRKSPRFGLTYWLQNTAPRTWILIHSGNIVKHTHGCILIGRRRGIYKNQRAVFNSRSALTALHRATDNKPFQLEITDV